MGTFHNVPYDNICIRNVLKNDDSGFCPISQFDKFKGEVSSRIGESLPQSGQTVGLTGTAADEQLNVSVIVCFLYVWEIAEIGYPSDRRQFGNLLFPALTELPVFFIVRFGRIKRPQWACRAKPFAQHR